MDKFDCDECSLTYKKKAHLKRHVQIKHRLISQQKTVTCNICKYEMDSKNERRHMRNKHKVTVLKRTKQVCNICEKEMFNTSTLRRHQHRIHGRQSVLIEKEGEKVSCLIKDKSTKRQKDKKYLKSVCNNLKSFVKKSIYLLKTVPPILAMPEWRHNFLSGASLCLSVCKLGACKLVS